jgi:hypothetical protein
MPQFNGKQEGKSHGIDLTCAAPATVSRREAGHNLPSHSAFITQPLDDITLSSGKAMKVVLPARIPANKVVVRPATAALP